MALCVSCLLGLQNDVSRVCLAVYSAPIVARMCGYPGELIAFFISFIFLTLASQVECEVKRLYLRRF